MCIYKLQKSNPTSQNYKKSLFRNIFWRRDNPRKSQTPVIHHPLI